MRCLVLVAVVAVSVGGVEADALPNQCPDDCPPDTKIVAPQRFVVTDHQAVAQCTFAPDGECSEGCVCMDTPIAWSRSPYQTSFLVKRAVIVIHGTGSDAIRTEDAVYASQDAFGQDHASIVAIDRRRRCGDHPGHDHAGGLFGSGQAAGE